MKQSPDFQHQNKWTSIDYKTLFKFNTDAILIIDQLGVVHHGNEASEVISGYSLQELKNQSFFNFIEDKEQAQACFVEMKEGRNTEKRLKLLHRSGELINCLVKCIRIEESDVGKGFFLVLKDMSMYDNIISKYQQSELNFKIIAENVQDVIILMNKHKKYLYVSPSVKKMFGFDSKTVEEALQENPFFYVHPEYSEILEQHYIDARKSGKPYQVVIKVLHKEKGWLWSDLKGTPIFDEENNFKQMVLVIRDISTQKERQEMLEYYAYHDPLTGLANRRYFEMCLNEAIERLNITGSVFSLILFDIDDFKNINDNWGHEIGDLVIKEIANRTQHIIGELGLAARLGGDEFIILLSNIKAEKEIREIIEKLQIELLKEFVTEKTSLTVTNSFGATICTKKYKSETYFFKSADYALYQVKHKGKNQYYITTS